MYINVFYLCLLWLLRAIFFYIPKFWDLPQNLGIFLGFPGIFLGCQVRYSKNSQSFWDVFKYLGWLGIAPKKSQNSGIIPKTSQKIPNSWDLLWDDPRILGRKAQVPFKPATFHNSASIDTTRLCAPNSVANIGQWSILKYRWFSNFGQNKIKCCCVACNACFQQQSADWCSYWLIRAFNINAKVRYSQFSWRSLDILAK